MSKFCKNCGSELTEGNDICSYCGTNNGEETNNSEPIIENNQNSNSVNVENVQEQNNNTYSNDVQNQNVNNNSSAKYNTNAIIAFVCSIVGLVIFGVILGFVSVGMRSDFFKTYKRI